MQLGNPSLVTEYQYIPFFTKTGSLKIIHKIKITKKFFIYIIIHICFTVYTNDWDIKCCLIQAYILPPQGSPVQNH